MKLRLRSVADTWRRLWLAACAACVVVVMPDVVLAQGTGLEEAVASLQDRTILASGWVRVLLIVVAGIFGLAAWAAWMGGRPNLKWVILTIVSLIGMGGHGLLVDYFIDPEVGRAKIKGKTGESVVLEETLR